jgi:hypothetical protein
VNREIALTPVSSILAPARCDPVTTNTQGPVCARMIEARLNSAALPKGPVAGCPEPARYFPGFPRRPGMADLANLPIRWHPRELSRGAQASEHPDALACAMPYKGSRIVLFPDRIASAAEPEEPRLLLAHVLVHEVTHILQGLTYHSKSGVMKARFLAEDAHPPRQIRNGSVPEWKPARPASRKSPVKRKEPTLPVPRFCIEWT